MGKRILCLVAIVVAANTHSAFAQVRSEYFRSLSADLQVTSGILTQNIKAIPFSVNYLQAINAYQGDIKFTKGQSMGYDFRLGYYFNRKRSLGVGLGINYYKQEGNLNLDTFHIEFRSSDATYPTFRQSITTTRDIREAITTTSINIPILLRYKKDFNEKWALTVDAGLLYNINVKNTYTTDANFDYEGIYKFEGTVPVYDAAPVPDQSSLLITKAEYLKDFPKGDVVRYFAFHDSIGKSVGLGLGADKKDGKVNYKSGSLGYTGEVAINYMVVRNICLRLGAYYTAQSFTNTSNNNALKLTDKVVEDASGKNIAANYNSMLNQVQNVKSNNFGLMLGVRVYFNKMAWKAPTDDMNKVTPARGRAE
ncbi:MAG: outer membrane beta-barrel protein [Taibaiella sp.]|nr:outer membrane beta-barrel protein [Taibaiella sp.]